MFYLSLTEFLLNCSYDSTNFLEYLDSFKEWECSLAVVTLADHVWSPFTWSSYSNYREDYLKYIHFSY